MKNTSFWTTSKTWQTNLAGKKIPHAHDTNGQQIPDSSADVTSLVFPAIGAILILLFGGFLLSSGNSCCHVEASNKKKNEDGSEGIAFPYIDNRYFPKPFPVLQQENNDVVEAVMETYSDLPQYAPINELMASIPGIARQPETRDACVSPIHCLDNISMLLGNQDDHVGINGDVESTYVSNEQDDVTNHNDFNEDHEDDTSKDIEGRNSQMDCTINILSNEADDDECSSRLNASSGIGTSSSRNTPALFVDSGTQPENVRNVKIQVQLQKSKITSSRSNTPALSIDSGRMSENMRNPPVNEHLQEIKRNLNASFGLGDAANKSLDDEADKEGYQSKQTTSFGRFTVEKWIDDAKESCDLDAKEGLVPFKWKRPAKLTKQDRLEILKRLQPNLNAVDSTTMNKVVANSSSQLQSVECDKIEQRNVGGYIVNTNGGRLSCLKVVRAPSSMCIHGNLCRHNCKSGHVNVEVECNKEDSGRGASYLGVASPRGASAFVEPARREREFIGPSRGASGFEGPTREASEPETHIRGASAFVEPAHVESKFNGPCRGASGFEGPTRGASEPETHIRGASAFVDNNSDPTISIPNQEDLTFKSTRQTDGCVIYKKIHHKDIPDAKQKEREASMDFRGASGFGQSYSDCLSVAGTASVTLSMAVQSEREDNTLASITLKQQTNKPELMQRHQVEESTLTATNHRIFNVKSEFNNKRTGQPYGDINATYDKNVVSTNHMILNRKLVVADEKTKKPRPNDMTVRNGDQNFLSSTLFLDGEIMTTKKIMETKNLGVVATDNMPCVAVATDDKPRCVVATDDNPRGVVATDDIPHGVVASEDKSSDANVNRSCDVISNDKRFLEFNPNRSSTPYHNDVTPSTQKDALPTQSAQLASHDERLKEDDGFKSTDMRSKISKMSLGKNSQALSGLLKALQREQRKKDCTTEQDCVTSNDCVTNNVCVTETVGVTKDNCVTNASCVTASDCVTDNNNRTLVSDKRISENTRSRSTEGSDVTRSGRRKQVVGKLKVCLFYNSNNKDKPVLYVTVLKASSLRQEFAQSDEDLYIQMRVSTRDDKTQQTKSVSTLSNTAVFNHLFQVHDITLRELQVSTIKLVLISGHSQQEEAVASVPLAELVARDKIKKTYLLKRYLQKPNKVNEADPRIHVPVGSLHLGLKYNSVDEKLLVNITKARGLPPMSESGETDPYVILTVKDDGEVVDKKITCTNWNQRNPQFDANFVLEISRNRIGTTSLLLRVMNNSANHSVIGAVNIGMESIEDSGRQHWGSVLDQDGVHDERWHKLLK